MPNDERTVDVSDAIEEANALAERVTRVLVDSWEAYEIPTTVGKNDRPATAEELGLILPLSLHVHRLVRAAITLYDAKMAFSGMPLIRSAFECAIQAMWIGQTQDGAAALSNRYAAQRRSLRDALKRSSLSHLGEIEVAGVDHKAVSKSDAQARRIDRMCADFVGGDDLYLQYKLLSGYSHGGLELADRYLSADDRSPAGFTIDGDAELDRLGLGIFWTAAAQSVLWAGRAFDFLDPANSRRRELRRAARELGVPAELTLTFGASTRAGRRHRK